MEDIVRTKINDMNKIADGESDYEFDIAGTDLGILLYTDNYDSFLELEEFMDSSEQAEYLRALDRLKKYLKNRLWNFLDKLPDEYKEDFWDENDLKNEDCDSLELGNMLWNETNANQNYRCPSYVEPILKGINDEMERVYWNIHQKEYESPFNNIGNKYKDDLFEVNAYAWDDEEEQKYNFKYKDIEISWYKYLGRDMTINKKVEPKEITDMFEDIMKHMRVIERNRAI